MAAPVVEPSGCLMSEGLGPMLYMRYTGAVLQAFTSVAPSSSTWWLSARPDRCAPATAILSSSPAMVVACVWAVGWTSGAGDGLHDFKQGDAHLLAGASRRDSGIRPLGD